MQASAVRFSIAAHAAWAPAATSPEDWQRWADHTFALDGEAEAKVAAMPPMLRRRAGALGKMALETAYACAGEAADIPLVFVSRHGDVARAVGLLRELAADAALSPTAFGLSVHNAIAGLFSIARADRANHLALAAGAASVEHGVLEACSLLHDGAPAVLLVACDCPLPPLLASFHDCAEEPHAFAWLMTAPAACAIGLALSPAQEAGTADSLPGSLSVLRFQLSGDTCLERVVGRQHWRWTRHG